MGDYGRIQALVIATMKGHVVYERFYSTFTDLERAEMRAALQVTDAPDGHCHSKHALCTPTWGRCWIRLQQASFAELCKCASSGISTAITGGGGRCYDEALMRPHAGDCLPCRQPQTPFCPQHRTAWTMWLGIGMFTG